MSIVSTITWLATRERGPLWAFNPNSTSCRSCSTTAPRAAPVAPPVYAPAATASRPTIAAVTITRAV